MNSIRGRLVPINYTEPNFANLQIDELVSLGVEISRAVKGDASFFDGNPSRRFRFRLASQAEVQVLTSVPDHVCREMIDGDAVYFLVRNVAAGVRMRLPVVASVEAYRDGSGIDDAEAESIYLRHLQRLSVDETAKFILMALAEKGQRHAD